jgi:hypothetical protein
VSTFTAATTFPSSFGLVILTVLTLLMAFLSSFFWADILVNKEVNSIKNSINILLFISGVLIIGAKLQKVSIDEKSPEKDF